MKPQPKREGADALPAALPPTEKSDAQQAPEAGAPPARYVFKIAPADPKNAFDFEDVADK